MGDEKLTVVENSGGYPGFASYVKCKNCRWWDNRSDIMGGPITTPKTFNPTSDETVIIGNCKRYAPKVEFVTTREDYSCGDFEKSESFCGAYWRWRVGGQTIQHMKMRFRATAGNVFVETIDYPEKVGQIFIPAHARNKDMPSIGIVFAIGGRLKTKKGVLLEPEFKTGDKVLFRKFSGTFCDVGDKHLVQIKIHDVMAVMT